MYRITTSKKVGFRPVQGGRVKIYLEGEKTPFYDYEPSGSFNLPKGVFFTDSKLVETNPNKYEFQLPKRERNLKIPNDVKITFGNIPEKCVIYKGQNRIEFDSKLFNSLSKSERLFILFHEIGHYRYKTEHYCDLYAAAQMLKLGYNPSQIARLPFSTLNNQTDEAYERKLKMISKMIKQKRK